MPTVSVIIPLFNKGSLVARTIDSILAQTFNDFEIIVVDDGSTDDSADVVKHYKDKRLRLIQQPNAGPGAARNRGVKESSSLYVAFIDADDEWFPEFLMTSVTNLRNNPDCVLSVANHIRSEKKILATNYPPCNIGITTGPWRLSPDAELEEFWGNFIYIQTWTTICRRDVFLKFGGFYEKHCTFMEDNYLWLQILLNHRIFRDTTPLHWYHTEDSELFGPNRRSEQPLLPFLSDHRPIRNNCPVEYRPLLDTFFAYSASINFLSMIGQSDIEKTMYLLKEFPMLKKWRNDWRYQLFKLRLKVAMPWLVPGVRSLKQSVFRIWQK